MKYNPLATYRLQLQPAFNFAQAADKIPYLASLGISHLYASPYLQAAPGSTHGYDVVDHHQVNTELGGNAGHTRLCLKLTEYQLGQILDIVPNHMAISPQNCWWWDVLENGQASRYATYFDVDWETPDNRWGNKILLPILEDHYGRVLEKGKIQLVRKDENFFIRYFEQSFPVAPHSLVPLFRQIAIQAGSPDLAFLADMLDLLPSPHRMERELSQQRDRNIQIIRKHLKRLLIEQTGLTTALDQAITKLNSQYSGLDELLSKQNYRLAYWTTSRQDLSYRRFFDVNSLVALHAEDRAVFDDTHQLILEWAKQGLLDGIRIDHPDGLRDPQEYLERLRRMVPDLWILVEKILGPDESLRTAWPVAGTTGYNFLVLIGKLFMDPAGETSFTELYKSYTGIREDYPTLLRRKKFKIITDLLGSDINRLTELMLKICEQHPRHRDYTRDVILDALKEVCACYPVYRTYIQADTGAVSEEDRRIVTDVITAARYYRPDIDPDLFLFLKDILLLKYKGDLEKEFILRLQQLTSPAMAKGAEDTAFYDYSRFVALNEVGGDPGRWGIQLTDFHKQMQDAAIKYPQAMLATTTHDTKRSEDVRARLFLLSEIPNHWQEVITEWTKHNEVYRLKNFEETNRDQSLAQAFKETNMPQAIPDRNTEYFLYQTLVGAWPIEKDRLLEYMQKAVREAKIYTAWRSPNTTYESGLKQFINKLYDDRTFLSSLEKFVAQLLVPGWVNALSQTLLKLTCPGIPDIYQGTELWFHYLVDPDNRRPVDFALRERLLAELTAAPGAINPEKILARMPEALPKLWVIKETLAVRRNWPDLFTNGTYLPLEVQSEKAAHVLAYLRAPAHTAATGSSVIMVIPRLLLSLGDNGQWASVWPKTGAGTGADVWADTAIIVPEGEWKHVFTGEVFQGPHILARELFKRFPVALLVHP